MKDKLAEAICERESGLRSNRATSDSLWQQIARYVIPREATFTEEVTPGVERSRYVLDSTAPRSLELFGSFIHTLMNNAAARWYKTSIDGKDDTALSVAMQQWREGVDTQIMADLAAEGSQYYSSAHQIYMDQGAFGTGVMYVDAVKGRIACRHYHLADCIIDEDTYGVVDTVFRQFKQTQRQAKQRWPNEDTGKMEKDAKGQQVAQRYMHAVSPTSDESLMSLMNKRDRTRASVMPFASVWLNAAEYKTIRVGGFEEMPYMTPRWYKVRGEIYGRSPATTVLPDIRMVNRMMETILRGAEKLVDPPLVIRDGGLVTPVRLFPGAVTFTDGEVKIEPLIPPGASRIEYGQDLLKDRQAAIREGFFIPLFSSPESPVKTATQVLSETQERNRAVSPMLIRMQNEFFHPLGRRVYGLETRLGRILPPPEPVGNVSVAYVSPLMSSQKELEALGVMRIIESLLPWGQIDPNVFDLFDPDQVSKVVHAGSGAPATVLRTTSQVKTVRQQRAQKEQAQAQVEAVKNLTPAIAAGAKVQQAQRA